VGARLLLLRLGCARTLALPLTRAVASQEHVKTMVVCQDYAAVEALKVSQTTFGVPDHDGARRRDLWIRWAADIAAMDQMMELRSWDTRKF